MRKPPRSPGRSGAAWKAVCLIVRNEEPFCRYCRIELLYDVPLGHPARGTVDHIVPLDQGGHPTDRANLAGCCHRCNVDKGNRTPEQWARAKGQKQGAYESPLWITP